MEEAINAKLADLKAQADSMATEQIDAIQSWIDNMQSAVTDFVNTDIADIVDRVEPVEPYVAATVIDDDDDEEEEYVVVLADVTAQPAAEEASYFGYGALTMGVAAVAAGVYIAKRKQKTAEQTTYDEEAFIQV